LTTVYASYSRNGFDEIFRVNFAYSAAGPAALQASGLADLATFGASSVWMYPIRRGFAENAAAP
jgi:hypothetical protein